MIRTLAVATTAVGVLAAATAAPASASPMTIGNYAVLSTRWTDLAWVWEVNHSCRQDPRCGTPIVDPVLAPATDDVNVTAVPRPNRSQVFQETGHYADGRYTLTVDVIDGLRCPGHTMASHDVYSWDAVTLTGTVTSTYDTACFGAPGGISTYDFSLIPM